MRNGLHHDSLSVPEVVQMVSFWQNTQVTFFRLPAFKIVLVKG